MRSRRVAPRRSRTRRSRAVDARRRSETCRRKSVPRIWDAERPMATRECVPLGAIDRWRLGNVSLSAPSTDGDSGVCPSRRHRPMATRECVPLGAIDRWRLGNASLSILAVCANSRGGARPAAPVDARF
jgi:hypothetical protein